MARVTDAILQPNIAFAQGRQNPLIDVTKGGQMGYAADYTSWVSNQAYVRKNLICILLEGPKGFQYLDNPAKWYATLRAMVELHPISIEGLNQGLEVEVAETSPVGGAGEMHQDFTNVTRQRSNPVFRLNEKYGMPFASFLQGWIRNLMMNEETKIASIGTLAGNKPTDMLADMYSATMAFIEPDPTHTKVVKSWIGTNMWPQGTGEISGRRELGAAGEAVTYDINFTGIFQVGAGVDQMCQTLLDSMSITGANPYTRSSFIDGISADVAATTEGYANGIATLANSAVRV